MIEARNAREWHFLVIGGTSLARPPRQYDCTRLAAWHHMLSLSQVFGSRFTEANNIASDQRVYVPNVPTQGDYSGKEIM